MPLRKSVSPKEIEILANDNSATPDDNKRKKTGSGGLIKNECFTPGLKRKGTLLDETKEKI